MSRKLIYFVDDIDTSFVLNDIKRCSLHFEQVILFSTEEIDSKEQLPVNVLVIDSFINWKGFNKFKLLFKNLYLILSIYFSECIALGRLLPIKTSIAVLCSNLYKSLEIQRHLSSKAISIEKDSIFYSFWFYDCIYLAFLKRAIFANRVVCRAHGGDVFEERSSLKGKTLFRNFQLRNIDLVLSVSKIGANYLKEKYPLFDHKILVSYLGSTNPNFINKISEVGFNLISCAKIRDIKRIYLIAEALLHINFELTWYHLGDENLDAKNDPTVEVYKQRMLELKSKSNIKTVQLGQLSNEAIFEFYKNTPVNLFISLSSTEGIPVSMMEAISFGIPILSTDVGGCNEIVNDETGILLPQNVSSHEVANVISQFRKPDFQSHWHRNKIFEFWQANFDQEKNYNKFFETIK